MNIIEKHIAEKNDKLKLKNILKNEMLCRLMLETLPLLIFVLLIYIV